MSKRYPKTFWAYSLLAPFGFMLSAAWQHNGEAAVAWGFAFFWVVIAGLAELRLWLETDCDEGRA